MSRLERSSASKEGKQSTGFSYVKWILELVYVSLSLCPRLSLCPLPAPDLLSSGTSPHSQICWYFLSCPSFYLFITLILISISLTWSPVFTSVPSLILVPLPFIFSLSISEAITSQCHLCLSPRTCPIFLAPLRPASLSYRLILSLTSFPIP